MKGTKSQANKSGWAGWGLGWAGLGWAGWHLLSGRLGTTCRIWPPHRSTAALQTTLQTPPSTFVTSLACSLQHCSTLARQL